MLRRRRHLGGDSRRRASTAFGVVGALLGSLAFADEARAQALLERFDPAERGSRFFVADSLELDGSLRFATGVVTSYGTQLRTFRQAGSDAERSDLVAHSVWLHPGASLVLSPGARLALDIPFALQRGEDVALDRRFYGGPGSPRLGDVRGAFDLRLAGRDRHDVDGATLAGGVVAWLPTGSASDYTSDDFVRVGARLAGSFRSGPVIGAARLGYMYRKDDLDPFGGVRLGSEANGVLALGYRSGPVVIGPELHGTTILKDAFHRKSTPVEVLFGGHFAVGSAQLGLGVGSSLVNGLGAPRFRGVVSLEWTPAPDVARDRDRDGVLDVDDMCPDVPGLTVAALGALGCPSAPRDADGDGIIDLDDACPDLPGVRSRDAMTHGCPDADHDGVPDPLDACPSVSGERSLLPRYNGCPPDADGDGVSDDRDACPEEPGIASDDLDRNGCAPPPPPDTDSDGISDSEDACPDAAGPKAALAAVSGCPLVRPEGTITLLPGVEADVARLASGLLANPEVRVFVAVAPVPGVRTDAKRTQLQMRALVDRLVELGVAKPRFDARRAKGAAAKRQVEVVIAAP